MKNVLVTASLLAMVMAVSGCEGTWKVQGECTSRNQCKIGGEIGGKFVIEKGSPANVLEAILISGHVFDASLFGMALEGTNVGVPANGLATIKLVDSANGTIHASRAFPWSRVGSNLVLTNPDSVNDWAYAAAAGADSIAYELHPFQVTGASANNVLSLAVKYEGATRATSSTTWSGGGNCRVGACAIQ